MAVEEPAPPRSVAGVAAMEYGEMDRIDVIDEMFLRPPKRLLYLRSLTPCSQPLNQL